MRQIPRGLVVLVLLLAGAARAADLEVPSPAWLLDHVRILSAPEMEGRGSGSPGADRAARHISRVFQDSGLKPGGDAGFLQTFSVPTAIRLGPGNSLTVLAPARAALSLGRDYVPLAVSADGEASGEVVFAGYGITAPELGWDDYAGLDVKDRIALVMAGDPGRDAASPFRKPDAYHYSERSHKIINAREHGARAVLLVARPAAAVDALPALRGISQPWGVPAAAITRAAAEALLAGSGRSLADLAGAIERGGAPRSGVLAGARVALQVALVREHGRAANVVAILPGTDARLREEAIVVGAHYDHLARGGEGSLAPDAVGVVHPGADDNASGTAAILGLARAFAAAGGLPRTLVFVAFAGEEMGLLGSTHYARRPAIPLERTVLMVNLDMVGRLREGRLWVGGVDTGSGLRRVVEDAVRGLGLQPVLRGDPFAPSDHTVFYAAGRPVLFFFTGAHADYHRPADTWEKVNAPGLATVATVAARVIAAVARQPAPPAFARVAAAPRETARGGYGPFFGVVPEFGEAERPGVRVGSVRPASPADKAGVRPGDVIIGFGSVTVASLHDLVFALRSHRAGDRVEVRILRDGREERVQALLEERR